MSRFQNLKVASLHPLLPHEAKEEPTKPELIPEEMEPTFSPSCQRKGMTDNWLHHHWPCVRRCHHGIIHSVVSSYLLLSHSPLGRERQHFVVSSGLLSPSPERRVWLEVQVTHPIKRWVPVWVLHVTASHRRKHFYNHKIRSSLCSQFGWCLLLLTSRPRWKTEDALV